MRHYSHDILVEILDTSLLTRYRSIRDKPTKSDTGGIVVMQLEKTYRESIKDYEAMLKKRKARQEAKIQQQPAKGK